jgi:hypothetical protein
MAIALSCSSRRGAHRCMAALLTFVILMTITMPAAGQSVRVTASVDSVRIGERFTVSLAATHRFTSSILFPSATAGPSVFGDLEVFARTTGEERYLGSANPGMRVDSVAYEVATFALDTARVPALPIRVVMGTDTMQVQTLPLRIPVQSTVSAGARGLRGMAPLATFPAPRWPWVLLTAVVLVLITGLVYYWHQRNASPDDESLIAAPPPVPPHEAATQRLDELERAMNWNDPEALEALFVELAATVRLYAARRLGLAALEHTTAELVRMLHARPALPTDAVEDLRAVLTQSDLVKFADKRPTSQEGRSALRTTREALHAVERALPALRPEAYAPAKENWHGEGSYGTKSAVRGLPFTR